MQSNLCNLVPDGFLSQSTIIKSLGNGAQGQVYLTRVADGKEYAIKKLPIRDDAYDKGIDQNALYEIDALMRLRGTPNVMEIVGVCTQNDMTCIIMNSMEGDCIEYINKTSFPVRMNELGNFFSCIVRGKAYMEYLNINHYDIKPDNILVKYRPDGRPYFYLSDFGLARMNYDDFFTHYDMFTQYYRAPEYIVRRDRRSYKKYTGDIWAIAVSVLSFIINTNIFDKKKPEEILRLIQQYTSLDNIPFSEFVNDLTFGLPDISGVRVDIPAILLSRLTPQQYTLVAPICIVALGDMLALEPDERPSAREVLLSTCGEQLHPTTDLQRPQPRKIDTGSLDMIMRLSVCCTMNAATTLVAIEMFTRFLGRLHESTPGNFITPARSNDTVAVCCCRLASIYTEGSYKSYTKFITALTNIYAHVYNTGAVLDLEETYRVELLVLHVLTYEIYNIELTPLIAKLYNTGTNICNISQTNFLLPLSQWF